MNSEVMLYTTGCPQCKVLKGQLEKKGVSYETCTDVEAMISMGITSVPMRRVDGELMNLQQALQWVKEVSHEN